MAFKNFMKADITKSLIVLMMALPIAACSGEDAEGVGTGSVSIDWIAPSLRADENTLSLAEIDGYRVYYGKTSGDYLNQIDIIDSTAQEATVTATRGNYYYVVTCIDTAGRESVYSEEVSIRI